MQQLREKDESFYRRQSFWMDTVEDSLEPRPALTRRLTADVVIIGAGFTGLWTAYYLKRHAPMLEVVVLEADIAGFGASGRNGGWVVAFERNHRLLITPPGLDRARSNRRIEAATETADKKIILITEDLITSRAFNLA